MMETFSLNPIFCVILTMCGAMHHHEQTAAPSSAPSTRLSGYEVDQTYLKQPLVADFDQDTQQDHFQVLKHKDSQQQVFEFVLAQGQPIYYQVPSSETFRVFQVVPFEQQGQSLIAIEASTLEDSEHCQVFYLQHQQVQHVAKNC